MPRTSVFNEALVRSLNRAFCELDRRRRSPGVAAVVSLRLLVPRPPAPAALLATATVPPAVLSVEVTQPPPGIAGTVTVAAERATAGNASARAATSSPTLMANARVRE